MRRRFRRSRGGETTDVAAPLDPATEGRGETDDVEGVEEVEGVGPGGGADAFDFDVVLSRQLRRADDVVDRVATAEPAAAPHDVDTAASDSTVAAADAGAVPGGIDPDEDPEAGAPSETSGDATPAPSPGDTSSAAAIAPGPAAGEPVAHAATRSPVAGIDFWDLYDRASAEADLAEVPPAAIIAVVGPLDAAAPVIRRCQDQHWMGDCDVFVLTRTRSIPHQPDWIVVDQPSELVAVLDEGRSDFPLLVLDVPHDLPAFVRPLVARLRECGVGLVHYVLGDEPDDEDLATWHGELGQPSVLDLAGPVAPDRVLDLLDRGEPVVSVAGRDLTAELLLAFRMCRHRT